MNVINTLTKLAKSIAPTAGARMAAAVVRRSRIIGIGINSYKTHPIQKSFAADEYKIFLHAEIAAINDAKRRFGEDLDNTSLWVVRVKRSMDGRWFYGNAKPCTGCSKYIRYSGIENVYWSTDNDGSC